METLPNGITVFNATPHVIRFWREDWDEPVEVAPDTVINARIAEVESFAFLPSGKGREQGITVVGTLFEPVTGGHEIADRAYAHGADVVIGSIIAAQAFPGRVYAMTPAKGYERVPPAEKRMNPDKFTVFSELVNERTELLKRLDEITTALELLKTPAR